MGWDIVNESKLSCGCIVTTYEHDFFSTRNESISYCEKCQTKHDKEVEEREKWKKEMEHKISIFHELVESLEYEKVPIKYTKNIKWTG